MSGSIDLVQEESSQVSEQDVLDDLAEQQYEDMKFRQKYGY